MFLKFSKMAYIIIALLMMNAFCKCRARFGGNVANKYFLGKQKFLLEILHRVDEPLMNQEWRLISQNLVLNESNYLIFSPEMSEFYATHRNGCLLSGDVVFNPFESNHYRQTLGLFYFFYNTNDWETLRTNACWARVHVNPGMFVFALTQALLKRIDLKGLILPVIYEILPQYFISATDMRIAISFDYAQWNRLGTCYKEFPQQQMQKSTDFKRKTLASNTKERSGSPKWQQAMEGVTVLWFPASRKFQNNLSFFLEDADWNAYWYYQNMGLWWSDIDKLNEKFSLWEAWFGNLQQILARYKLEYYAVLMSEPVHISDHTEPNLLLWQGSKFRIPKEQQDQEILKSIRELTSKVDQAISEQRLQLSNGEMLPLLQGRNWPVLLNALYGQNLFEFFRKFFGLSGANISSPQLLEFFETQLRDPKFYFIANALLTSYHRLRQSFQSYEISQLKQSNIKITDVSIDDRLETFFEPRDVDVSNLLSSKHYYYEGQLLWERSLRVRQQQLQHKPFTIKFNIISPTPQAIVMRAFVAPVSAALMPDSYFQLDTFVINLIAGTNIVERSSRGFFGSAESSNHLSYTELYRYTLLALNDEYDFPLNLTENHCGFPNRLLLPRGGPNGQGVPVKFFFIATSYAYRFRAASNFECDFSDGMTRFDELPMGFPFDYEHEEIAEFTMENTHWKRAKIYHLN